MSDLRELYQEVILDHSRQPRNFRRPPGANREARGDNPLCGDKVTVFLTIEDGRVKDVGFEGRGCAISMASASLMTEVLKGKTLAEAAQLFKAFHAEVTGGETPATPEALEEDLDRLAPLEGVKAYPARVKCATLAWHAFEAALRNGSIGTTVKTE